MSERPKNVPRFLRTVRLNAMLDAVGRGVTDGDELQKEADKAARRVTDRRGRGSVSKFESLVPKIESIREIADATEKEDREWATDKWVFLKKPIAGRTRLPLQIKSSPTGVDEFKNSQDFKKRPFHLVVNSAKTRKDKEIIGDFEKELERVRKELEFRTRLDKKGQ
jgi:hypothetical protein